MLLDAVSSHMTTFYTMSGRYKFLKMPFWIEFESRYLSQKDHHIYQNCGDAVGIADDMLVFDNNETHDDNPHKAMTILEVQALGLVLTNILFRQNVMVPLITCTPQKESKLIQREWIQSTRCNYPSTSSS